MAALLNDMQSCILVLVALHAGKWNWVVAQRTQEMHRMQKMQRTRMPGVCSVEVCLMTDGCGCGGTTQAFTSLSLLGFCSPACP